MVDPFSITTGVISVANGTFTLALNFWKLRSVDDDLEKCLKLLLMTANDIERARKLCSLRYPQHHPQSKKSPHSLLNYANGIIKDLKDATDMMKECVEAVRVQKSVDNSISMAKRFSWVFKGKDMYVAQQYNVTTAHNRVLAVITILETLSAIQLEVSATPPAYEEATLLKDPNQTRELKGKSTTIVVTESEEIPDSNLKSHPPISQLQCHKRRYSALPILSPAIHEGFTEEDMLNEKTLTHWQSYRAIHEDFTEEDMLNEKILARWQSYRGRQSTEDGGRSCVSERFK